ncbi:MAG TPA: PKD domain-containing protein [bacterium]|nr:PKD domain-containing protein [bacterium]
MTTKLRWMVLLLLMASALLAKENIFLVNYGPEQSIREGDDDFQQIIFIRLEASCTDSLYLRIFDADCGGENDLAFGPWNTGVRFSLRGGAGAFSSPSLQMATPTATDRDAGKELVTGLFGENRELDNSWYNFAHFAPAEGEQVGAYRYFKLVVQGVSGNDANAFDLRVSSSPSMNITPAGAALFSCSPTLRLRKSENVASITFMVPETARSITVNNFDLAGAVVQLVTPFRSNLPLLSSGQGEWAKTLLSLEPLEAGHPCAIVLGQGSESPNDVSLYISDDQGTILPIALPVYLSKLNRRPLIQKSLIALSDCHSIVFDAKDSTDPDGDLLEFRWDFGDGTTATGSRVAHLFPEQTTYQALLIVSDNSGEVGNSVYERFSVKVNKPPLAKAAADLITAPLKAVVLDGSASSDQDGRLTAFNWTFGDGHSAAGSKTTHAYERPGTYTATLRIEDDSDSPCNFATDELKVWVNAPPVAAAGEDTRGALGQELTFSGEKSSDSDGELTAWVWDFGDGGKASGKLVRHAWMSPGLYRVRLAVTDNAGVDNSTQTDELTVFINDPPVARAGADAKGAIAESLPFDGSGSFDKDGALTGYKWDFGDGNRKEDKQTTHAYQQAGKYMVVLTVKDNSSTPSDTRSDSLVVTVNQPPVADAGPDQLVTASEVHFSAARSHDTDGELIRYDWSFGDGAAGSGVSPAHVYSKSGTYTVKLTVTDNSGTKNNQAGDECQVVINEKPFADAGPDRIAAAGQELLFDGSGSRDPDGQISGYRWDFGDGQSAAGKTAAHRYSRPGKMNARLSVQDNTGQEAAVDFDEAIITVNGRPTARAGHNQVIAPGTAVLFDGSASSDPDPDSLSFRWQFSDGQGAAAAARTTRTFTSPGSYSVILTVDDGSTAANAVASDTVTIRVNHAPIAHAGKNIHSCDKTLLLDGGNSVDPDGDPLSYSWDFGDGSAPLSGVRVLHDYARGGTYPVILTVDDGLGLKNSRHSSSITARIDEPPVADAGPNETYCSGEVIIFNASGSKDPENGLLKYEWDFGDGAHAEGLNPTRIFKQDGTYLVTLTVTDDSGLPCNTSVATKAIRIIESPVAIAGPDQEVCTNTQVAFDGSASRDFDGVVNSYFWDFGDGTTGGGAAPGHTYKKAGIYRAVLTITGDLRGDCDNTDTDELIITVHDAPLAQIACPEIAPVQQPVSFDGSASTNKGQALSDYLWDFGDGAGGSGVRVTHTYAKSGRYLVKLTVSTGGTGLCNISTTLKMITINDQPVAEAGPDQSAGINQIITLDAGASRDPDGVLTAFLWDFGAGQTRPGCVIRHAFAAPGRHPVVLTVTDNTSAANNSGRDTLWVVVNDPVQPVITADPAHPCPGEAFSFSAAGSKNTASKKMTCRWDFGDGTNAEGLEALHTYAKPGRYTVTLIMDDGLGLENSLTQSAVTIPVSHPPVASAGGERSVCPGESLLFDAGRSWDADGSDWTVHWDFGDGTASAEKSVRHAWLEAGRFTVRLRVTDPSGSRCATAEDFAIIMVNSRPVAAAGADRKAFCGAAHDAVLFDASASSDADGDPLTCTWDFGDGTRTNGSKLYHLFDKPGIYRVKLTVDDGRQTACSAAGDEAVIEVVNHP